MKLRVTAETGVIVGHQWRLPGEVLEVPDYLGISFLNQRPYDLVAFDEAMPACSEADPLPSGPPETGALTREIGISSRVEDALEANGITTVAGLREALAGGDAAMRALPGIGPRALDELKQALVRFDAAAEGGRGERG